MRGARRQDGRGCVLGVFFVKQTVGRSQYAEFGTAVKRIADVLLGWLGQCLDEFYAKGVSLMQEGMLFGQLACDDFWPCLAIAHGGQSLGFDAVLDKIPYYAFGTSLGEFLVVFLGAAVVAVCTHFDSDVGIFFQQGYKAVQSLCAVFCKFGTVECVEYITDEYGCRDIDQGEL